MMNTQTRTPQPHPHPPPLPLLLPQPTPSPLSLPPRPPPRRRPTLLLPTAAAPDPVAVTVAAPPHHTLTLALPIQQPRPSPAAGGREDCWSEGATSTLIDAWGERYLELSRGNLKQKHWQEVADAVTSRDGYTKAPKTDVQCKNRIDTLKKKYKVEKGKASSSWPFFHRLDLLLGPNHKSTPPTNTNPQPSKIPAGVPIRPPANPQFPQRHRSGPNNPINKRPRSPPSVTSKSDEMSAESSEGYPPETAANGNKRRRMMEDDERGEEEAERRMAGIKELTRAVLRFGEVYERVESSKLRQMMEMEKQRMGFARELELQRMQFFMKTQMELSQLQHHHGRSRRRRAGDAGVSSNHHHHHHHHNHNHNNNNNSSNSNDNSHNSG
ncbi:trihelix transcription factor ENAP2-like [Typha latifolia]|uniref:trihelix transcription factor ENAP2-like n=1 Tax=Typha latifolia TaxID=4733 RepID=UPI003C2D600D